jgi:RNAse (barnase) inhibitor barstar
MNTVLVPIPTDLISDWPSFHQVCAEALGFPSFYGANMDAWIDCMTSADDPEAQMLTKAVHQGELLTLQINDAADFAFRCPEQFKALMECTAFVNYRRVEVGGKPVLSLLMSGDFP